MITKVLLKSNHTLEIQSEQFLYTKYNSSSVVIFYTDQSLLTNGEVLDNCDISKLEAVILQSEIVAIFQPSKVKILDSSTIQG